MISYSHDDDDEVVDSKDTLFHDAMKIFLIAFWNSLQVWICPLAGGWLLRETNLQLEGFIISIFYTASWWNTNGLYHWWSTFLKQGRHGCSSFKLAKLQPTVSEYLSYICRMSDENNTYRCQDSQSCRSFAFSTSGFTNCQVYSSSFQAFHFFSCSI